MDSMPSQIGPEGIRYDFQDGCRVSLPEGQWHLEIKDLLTQTVLFSDNSTGGLVTSTKRYFIPFSIKVSRAGRVIFNHIMNLRDQEVLIDMHLGGIGDHIAWMGHVEAFVERHGCNLTCIVRTDIVELFREKSDLITITDNHELFSHQYYARYKVLIFFNDNDRNFQPTDYRQVGLGVMAAYILGLPPQDRRPTIRIAEGGRPIPEEYVCIGTQASGHNKYWNNPTGWLNLIPFLKKLGYRVICIDRDRVTGSNTIWHHIPHGVEDMTGQIPLTERARWLTHAAFFIGLSSGLSWVAWAAECPVILISGFTEPYNEFATPYRVINRNVCNGCSNDVTLEFERSNYMWCPRHADTERDFECTKMISSRHVEQTIEQLIADQQDYA